MIGTAGKAGQSAKNLTQQIAKQMAEESFEILKDVKSQVTGAEISEPRENSSQNPTPGSQGKILEHQNELQDKAKSGRRMEALNQELNDIRKQDLFKDLQTKVAQGEEVPIADFTELSMEQKQVLQAQMEAYQNQKSKTENQSFLKEVPAVHSKPSRRFGAGQKAEAEKQRTRVEKPVPPSG